MKTPATKFAARTFLTVMAAACGNAAAYDSITTAVTNVGGFFSITGTATGTAIAALPDDTYTAYTQIYSSGGVLKYQGSSSYVKTATAAKTIELSTVGGTAYTSGMSVSASSQLVCPVYSDTTNVAAGTPKPSYVGVLGPQGLLRYNLLPAVSNSSPTGCSYQVLEKGNNQILFAYIDTSNNFVTSSSTSVNNTDSYVSSTSVRMNLTWTTAADLDMKFYKPTALAVSAITSANPAVVTTGTHGLAVGDPVIFATTGTLPSPIIAGKAYFITAVPSGTTFRFSATNGGTDVDTSNPGSPSGTHSAQGFKQADVTTTGATVIWKSGMTGTGAPAWAKMEVANSSGYGPEHITASTLTASTSYLVTAKAVSATSSPTAALWVYDGGGNAIMTLNSPQFTAANQEYKFGTVNVSASGTYSFTAIESF